jgi:ferric-dicitrate binding protein FerR (iron transport regulator)
MPGEKAIYNATVENLIKQKWNYQEDLSWIDGILYFEDNSFAEVVAKLESWYGVSFKLTGKPLQEKHYSAAFDNENLENVLLNLSFSHLFDYDINGKSISIKFNNE